MAVLPVGIFGVILYLLFVRWLIRIYTKHVPKLLPFQNVSALVGKTAFLTCVVRNLKPTQRVRKVKELKGVGKDRQEGYTIL